jgi:hypothetical protein
MIAYVSYIFSITGCQHPLFLDTFAGLLMFEFSLFGFGCVDKLMPGWIRRPSLLDPAFGASQKLIHLAVGQ